MVRLVSSSLISKRRYYYEITQSLVLNPLRNLPLRVQKIITARSTYKTHREIVSDLDEFFLEYVPKKAKKIIVDST